MKTLKNNKGQTLTEFLFVIILLVFLVLAHTQLSLSYVLAHVIHYTTFMKVWRELPQPVSFRWSTSHNLREEVLLRPKEIAHNLISAISF